MITILDFYANWCKPCNKLLPILEELETELDFITIERINTDDNANAELVTEYKIETIPTLILLIDGLKIGKIVGAVPKDKLLEILNAHHNEIGN
jgi:thioredoxin 1